MLAQYVYETQTAVAAAVADLEHRLDVMQQNARQQEVATAFEFHFLHGATEGGK